jgi:hypothetical protein
VEGPLRRLLLRNKIVDCARAAAEHRKTDRTARVHLFMATRSSFLVMQGM